MPSQTFCDTEMRALEAAGVEIEIYSCSPPTTSFRHGADERPRGPVFYAPPGKALEWGEAAARHGGRWPAEMVADHAARYGDRYDPMRRARHAVYFADLFRQRGIQHFHVHFANRATHAALFIHALTGLPFSFTAHAQDFLVDLNNDELLGEMCEKAAFVVAVSEWSRGELIRRCPQAEGKIHRVYNGLPLDRWPEPADGETDSNPLQILSVGRLVEFKGFGDLIDACAGLKQRGVTFRCEIVGDGPLRGTLARQIEELGLNESVTLAGLLPQGEIRARLAACDVFALACRVDEKGACDVLPTVILEAMAAARPVVSTRLAGVPEIVADGQTGLLTEPGDVPALAAALHTLSRDPGLRRGFGLAGRRKLEANFASADTTRQIAALFTGSAVKLAPRPVFPPTGLGTVCLVDRWPISGCEGADAALLAWREHSPGSRLVALTATGSPPAGKIPADQTIALLSAFEFLPDAMVLEGEWRERSADAHRLEMWRDVHGGGSEETESFLQASRQALYLHHHWLSRGDPPVKHLYAVGPLALRCAWALRTLDARRTASFYVAPGDVGKSGSLPGATLRRLAKGFTGGWVAGERKLATELGPGFRGDDAPATALEWRQWMETVRAFCPAVQPET